MTRAQAIEELKALAAAYLAACLDKNEAGGRPTGEFFRKAAERGAELCQQGAIMRPIIFRFCAHWLIIDPIHPDRSRALMARIVEVRGDDLPELEPYHGQRMFVD